MYGPLGINLSNPDQVILLVTQWVPVLYLDGFPKAYCTQWVPVPLRKLPRALAVSPHVNQFQISELWMTYLGFLGWKQLMYMYLPPGFLFQMHQQHSFKRWNLCNCLIKISFIKIFLFQKGFEKKHVSRELENLHCNSLTLKVNSHHHSCFQSCLLMLQCLQLPRPYCTAEHNTTH